jgi:hypothetical protein
MEPQVSRNINHYSHCWGILMRILWALALASVISNGSDAIAVSKATSPLPAHRSATPASHQIPTSGVLHEADLVAIAKIKANSAEDKFSDDPTIQYIGRDVAFTVNGGFNADYNKDTHSLTVAPYDFEEAFELSKELTLSHSMGQNGFGAKTVVAKHRGTITGVWIGSRVDLRVRKPFIFQAELDGAGARDLSKALRLRLTGTIVRANDIRADERSPVHHTSVISDATIGDPNDIWLEGYYVAVAFTKIEWIDSRTGAAVSTIQPPGSLPLK